MWFIIKLKTRQYFRKKWQALKQWLLAKYQGVVNSKVFLGILMLTIGVAWTWAITFSAFEGKNLVEYVRESVAGFAQLVSEKVSPEKSPKEEWVFTNPNPIEKKIADPVTVSAQEEKDPVLAVIKRISHEEGVDWRLVYAVCKKESGCNPEINCANQYGRCDEGKSFGPYQIYNPSLDPERIEMAEDFEAATRWTINNGKRFKDDPATFFKNHNGLYKKTNQWYVDDALKIFATL